MIRSIKSQFETSFVLFLKLQKEKKWRKNRLIGLSFLVWNYFDVILFVRHLAA